MITQRDYETPNWELYKENAAPLERGRDVKILSRALAPETSESLMQRQQNDKNIRAFEKLVRPAEKFAQLYAEKESRNDQEIQDILNEYKVDKDPIVHWLRYIKYHEETYPSDTHAQFLLKERCTQSLLHHPKYTNDVRFIRVCVLYADRTENPHEQFKLFHKHKIGSEVGIFWLAWAWVAEKRKDFQFADKIFRKAIQKKAEPIQIVNQRYKQFQRRMSRNWLNANASNPDSVYDEENDGDQLNKRGALAGLTEEGVRQNHRGRGANSMANSTPVLRNGQAATVSIQQKNLNIPNEQVGKFSIFTDEDQDEDNGYDLNNSTVLHDENARLPRMVKQNDRMKENTLTAETWNERGGLQGTFSRVTESENDQGISSVVSRWASSTGESLVAGGTSSQPAFQVFVDEDCAGREEEAKRTRLRKTNERGLKPRFDEKVEPLRSFSRSSSTSVEGSESSLNKNQQCSTNSMLTKTSTHNPMSRTEKVPLGFDKSLITKDKRGEEQCFEQHRAKIRKWNIVPISANFNLLLRKVDDVCSVDSCMECDDTSTIEDVEMDEASRSISMIHEEQDYHGCNNSHSKICNKEVRHAQSKKVLFGANTSFGNTRAHNTSTASSTVDERDAVGVAGDKEETLNTRFAARELSMMFSSPMGADQSAISSTRKMNDKLLFPVYRDDSLEAVPESGDIPTKSHGKFSIFCDDEDDMRNDEALVDYKKERVSESVHQPNVPHQTLKSEVGTKFDFHNDESDSSDDEDVQNGDTASLADLLDVMKDITQDGRMNDFGKGGSSKSSTTGLGGFDIFCDDDDSDKGLKIGEGIVLSADSDAFGDLSFIPSAADGDTCHLQETIKNMSIS